MGTSSIQSSSSTVLIFLHQLHTIIRNKVQHHEHFMTQQMNIFYKSGLILHTEWSLRNNYFRFIDLDLFDLSSLMSWRRCDGGTAGAREWSKMTRIWELATVRCWADAETWNIFLRVFKIEILNRVNNEIQESSVDFWIFVCF